MASPSRDAARVNTPLVSVVLPVFNAERYIVDAVDSAAGQTYQNLEILVADDGSTDATRERALACDCRGKQLRWLEAPGHAGRPSVPRNRAIAAARGEFVAFLDADDTWTPGKIADQVSAMTRHPDVLLVYSVIRAFGDDARFAGPGYGLKPWPTRAAVEADVLEEANTIPTSSVMVRRDVVEQLGGFDEDPQLNAVEDYDLWLRISRLGPIAFIPRIHGFYRVHAAGISRDPAVQLRRAEYLRQKRQLKRFTFREFKRRSPLQSIARNSLDVAMTLWLVACERLDRRFGRPVPVHHSSRTGSTS